MLFSLMHQVNTMLWQTAYVVNNILLHLGIDINIYIRTMFIIIATPEAMNLLGKEKLEVQTFFNDYTHSEFTLSLV